MCLKLKFLTCPECAGHSYNSYSSNGITANVDCRCGHKYKAAFEYKSVNYPDVTILGEKFKRLDVEKEIFYDKSNDAPFGVNVKIKYHKESHYAGRRRETRYNATEFHYMYEPICTIFVEQGVAIESNIHYCGGTYDLSHIKSIVVTKATKKHRDH
jgi:hypothetical protein